MVDWQQLNRLEYEYPCHALPVPIDIENAPPWTELIASCRSRVHLDSMEKIDAIEGPYWTAPFALPKGHQVCITDVGDAKNLMTRSWAGIILGCNS